MMQHLLHNDKIALRAVEPSDVDMIYRWENDPEVWTVSNTVEPFSRAAIERYVASVADINDFYANRQLRLVITLPATGEAVGTVDFLNFNPSHNRAELGLFIAKEHQGRGYGTEALKMANRYAAEVVGLRQLYVYVPEDNAPSLAMVRRAGYQEVGILQNWLRVGKTYQNVILLQRIF